MNDFDDILTDTATLERPTADGSGAWTAVATVKGSLQPLPPPAERQEAAAIMSEANWRWFCYPGPDVRSTDRLVIKGSQFYVVDTDAPRSNAELLCIYLTLTK